MGKKPELDNITLPVYEVCHKEIEEVRGDIPTELDIENIAKREIQDDKDILSQIVYDEEEHTVIFPKGIVPLKFYEESVVEDYAYLDYENLTVVRDSNDVMLGLEIFLTSDKRIGIRHTDTNMAISELIYIYVTDIDYLGNTLKFNSYFIFNPITSAGTKLYKHTFSGTVLISTTSTSYTGMTGSQLQSEWQNNVISGKLLFSNTILKIEGDESKYYISYADGLNLRIQQISLDVNPISDTVTEL